MVRIHILISKASSGCAAGVAGLQPLEHLRWVQAHESSLLPAGQCFGLAVGLPAGSTSSTLPFLPARAPCCFTSGFQLIP